MYHVPSRLTKCALAVFESGKLELYRLEPIIEKMAEHVPSDTMASIVAVMIGSEGKNITNVVVCTQAKSAKKTESLQLSFMELDPRKMWLRHKGNRMVTRPKCTPLQVSCDPTSQSIAVLYDDGALTVTPLTGALNAVADSTLVVQLDPKTDAQLMAPPNNLCCSLNHYTADYIFLVYFSRKLNCATTAVYDVQLLAQCSSQSLPRTSDWQQKAVSSVFQNGAMALEVGRGDTKKSISVSVPTESSKLLDVFMSKAHATDAPMQETVILDLNTALAGLDEGTDSAALTKQVAEKSKPINSATSSTLGSVKSACAAKKWSEVPKLVDGASEQFFVNESDVPGLLDGLLKSQKSASQHVTWYFQTVRRIKASSLITGLRYLVKTDTAPDEAAAAVLIAAAQYDGLAPKLAALEITEVVFLLKHLYKKMCVAIQSMGRSTNPNGQGVTMSQLLCLSNALIDAHIMELMAAGAEVQEVIANLYSLCKAYTQYVQSLGELNGSLSALIGDPNTMQRAIDSKDLSPGILRPPVRPQAGLTYYKIQPTVKG